MQPVFNVRPKNQTKNNQQKALKHQNQRPFKVSFNPYLEDLKQNSDLGRLCLHCYPKIKWKFQFGKYKPRTQPGKCNTCDLKAITKAYRHYCDKCCDEHKVCSKCGESIQKGYHQESLIKKSPAEASNEENQFNALISKLAERSRRKVLRLKLEEKCEIKEGKFWDTEKNREVSLIKYKNKVKDRLEGDEEDSGTDSLGDFDPDESYGSDDDDEDDSEDDKKKKKDTTKPAAKKTKK